MKSKSSATKKPSTNTEENKKPSTNTEEKISKIGTAIDSSSFTSLTGTRVSTEPLFISPSSSSFNNDSFILNNRSGCGEMASTRKNSHSKTTSTHQTINFTTIARNTSTPNPNSLLAKSTETLSEPSSLQVMALEGSHLNTKKTSLLASRSQTSIHSTSSTTPKTSKTSSIPKTIKTSSIYDNIFNLILNDSDRLKKSIVNDFKTTKDLKSLLLKYEFFNHSLGEYQTQNTILLQAISQKNIDVVNIILQFANGISINSPDMESNYTPIHKAIGSYPTSLLITISLLNHNNINLNLKDNEGLDWIDLFYSTIKLPKVFAVNRNERKHTATSITIESDPDDDYDKSINNALNFSAFLPSTIQGDQEELDQSSNSIDDQTSSGEPLMTDYSRFTNHSISISLWTWGSNNNQLLGSGLSDSRFTPEIVDIEWKKGMTLFEDIHELDIQIEMVEMSKYHALLIANRKLFSYGIGTGGRLGHGDESSKFKPTLIKMAACYLFETIAVANDHSLAIDDRGRIFSWGWNKNGQVGHFGDEKIKYPTELTVLKKIRICGVAASKFHSAAFCEAGAIYTWGKNNGQLGYDSINTIQYTPKKIISFSPQPILQISATPNATLILTKNASNHIYVFLNNVLRKVVLPSIIEAPTIARNANVNTSSVRTRNPIAIKLSRGGGSNRVAIVLSNGDVCVWSAIAESNDSPYFHATTKNYWRARKKHNVAIDCAIGVDNNLIIATGRGHVYIGMSVTQKTSIQSTLSSLPSQSYEPALHSPRWSPLDSPSRNQVNSPSFENQTHQHLSLKFSKIDGLEHISSVSTSGLGSFSAIRWDFRRPPDTTLPDILSFNLANTLKLEKKHRKGVYLNHVYVDSLILAARSSFAHDLFSNGKNVDSGDGWSFVDYLDIKTCKKITILNDDGLEIGSQIVSLVVEWMLGCRITVPWPNDFRLRSEFSRSSSFSAFNTSDSLLRFYKDFKRIVKVLKLDLDESMLGYTSSFFEKNSLKSHCDMKVIPPTFSFIDNLKNFCEKENYCDIVVETSDGRVRCHEVILASRSGFFHGFFKGMWKHTILEDNCLLISLPQTSSLIFKQLYRHLSHPCLSLFSNDLYSDGKEEWMKRVTELQVLADELIVPHVVHLCSIVLGRFLTLRNVISIFEHSLNIGLGSKVIGSDSFGDNGSIDFATKKKNTSIRNQYHSNHLSETCLDFIIRNLETFLKSRMLQKSSAVVIHALEDKIHYLQEKKLPFMFGVKGYYNRLFLLEELRKKEEKEERRLRHAAEKGKGIYTSHPEFSGTDQHRSPSTSQLILKPEMRSTSTLSLSTAVYSPSIRAASEMSPLSRHCMNLGSSVEDFNLDSDEYWTESRSKRKNSYKRSSFDDHRSKHPITGSPVLSNSSLEQYGVLTTRSHHTQSVDSNSKSLSNSPYVPIKIGNASSADQISPFFARSTGTPTHSHMDITGHRFLGSGLKLVKQMSNSIKEALPSKNMTKSQLTAQLSPTRKDRNICQSLNFSGNSANGSSILDVTQKLNGIQIKTAKLSQRDRKRLITQSLTSPSAQTQKATESKINGSVWGDKKNLVSKTDSTNSVSILDIQKQEETLREKETHQNASPTPVTRWTSSGLEGSSNYSPSLTSSSKVPKISLVNIQQQQAKEKLVIQKVKSKTIAQIQAEESAISELHQFYKDTRGTGTGEWVSIERIVIINL